MGKYLYSIAIAACLALVACSHIDENDRLIYVAPAEAQRNVLIEDFTGQRCVNCPNATEEIHKILDTYGANVVAVAIHSGPFGGVSAVRPGLLTDTGKEYWDHWFNNDQGQPVAKINRGKATDNYTNWVADVTNALKVSTDVSITGEASVADSCISISAKLNAKAGTKGKVQVWVTEDSIVDMQRMPDGSWNRTYVHNHIFRAPVNGTWGEGIEFGESVIDKAWTIKVNKEWKPANMNAVIFVYDDLEVKQVISAKVK
ncbi:MAG: Omp28 family outer membrane lipoprotein [Bacteroidaceae bacterium]|nr:Omp28 family outer membrane lipoprotein [Bacteroidaceae bacterium]